MRWNGDQKMALANSLRHVRFCCLAGVQKAHLRRLSFPPLTKPSGASPCTPLEGEEVLGRWMGAGGEDEAGGWRQVEQQKWLEGKRARDLVENFANWSNDATDIARFTKKYGPLRL